MNTYRCQQCHCIWSDSNTASSCPNCGEKTFTPPVTSEKSIRFRLLQSQGKWSLECKGNFEDNDRFEKISWQAKPTENTLHETLNDYLTKWLVK